MTTDISRKLDAGLMEYIEGGYILQTEAFPVILTAEVDKLEEVIGLVNRHRGRVRHVLRPLNAVSAWLTLHDVETIAQSVAVVEIELSRRTMSIA